MKKQVILYKEYKYEQIIEELMDTNKQEKVIGQMKIKFKKVKVEYTKTEMIRKRYQKLHEN